MKSLFGGLCRAGAPLVAALALGAACGGSPEENSGGDAYRNEAQPMPFDEWVTGELDRDNGDTTDWKVIEVEDAGKLKVELSAEKKGARVFVGVYDKHGVMIGVGNHKAGGDALAVPVNAKSEGRFFIRIEHKDGDKTAYSVRVEMGDGGGGGGPDL